MRLQNAANFQVFHQGPNDGPLMSQKVRQISSFCVSAVFIFLLIIARFRSPFLPVSASVPVQNSAVFPE